MGAAPRGRHPVVEAPSGRGRDVLALWVALWFAGGRIEVVRQAAYAVRGPVFPRSLQLSGNPAAMCRQQLLVGSAAASGIAL